LLIVVGVVPVAVINYREKVWDFRDDAPQRGAATSPQDLFGDGYNAVRYLDQGWNASQSLWFYTTTQGSDLVPYDFFLSLATAGSDQLLRSVDNIKRWRYLPQTATTRNPDALPVGFVRDEYHGREYLGFSCSACHTGQINYKGTALRVDGAPSMADMDTFMHDLGAALDATAPTDGKTQCGTDVCARFVKRVLALGHYRNEADVIVDLVEFKNRIAAYNQINFSATAYGYARLDAFGRIYNRVLEHVLQKPQLAGVLPDIFEESELPAVQSALEPVLNGKQSDHVIQRSLPLLSDEQRQPLLNEIFNSPNAPVSYPFLWDIPQHDYVQWNGIAANAGLGPLGRNAGEVIGVFGTLDWAIKDGFSVSALVGGQGNHEDHISYESSVYVHNLRRIEAQLKQLQSPKWPEDVLGKIDSARVRRGGVLFDTHCVTCHEEIDRSSPDRRVIASMTKLEAIGTDPQMAKNSVGYSGYSGILRNQYVNALEVGNILIDKKAPVAALLTQATTGVVADPYPNANYVQRVVNWINDLGASFFSNEIKASIKNGNYNPDTTAAPFASLLAYKGRSLNGIWATAPYLHNGSVPTLYDILLPQKRPGDPPNEEYRPEHFVVGSREFDPDKVGYVSQGYQGFSFDTSLKGNSNAGHEYGTLHDESLGKRGLKAMTKEDRLDLLEYLKSL
jgi:mono/diheme cytochrome c family protein